MSAARPTDPPRSVLVVGGSLAGLSTARALREAGFGGVLTLVGDEPEPYDRPPLSKALLAGEVDAAACGLREPEDEALGLRWELGRSAVALDAGARAVALDDGRTLAADAIVLATGAGARPLPGLTGRPGVHALRTLADAHALRGALAQGGRLVVVGGGFVGCEVASTALGLGLEVHVVERDPVPLARALGAEVGAACSRLLEADGVVVHAGRGVASLEPSAARAGDVLLDDGTRLPADVVLVGVGSAPAVGWLAGSGVVLEDGVRCDVVGRTAAPGVWAVGDCARGDDAATGLPVRHEHWSHAAEQPAVLAAAMLGTPPPRPRPPSFWSDQGARRLRFAGRRSPDDAVRVVDGDPELGRFVALYEDAGAPTAVVSVDDPRGHGRWRRRLVTPAPVVGAAA